MTSIGDPDIFLAKYNTDGTLLWATQVESDNSIHRLPDVALDNIGNCLITSRFLDAAIFEKGEANEATLISSGGADVLLAKYNSDGVLLWAKRAGGTENDDGLGIAVDGSGNCYVTGFFIGSATFGQGEANEMTLNDAGNGDMFVAKFNGDGMLLSAKRTGSLEFDSGRAITADAGGNSFVVGTFQGDATFGAGESNEATLSAGFVDMFVAKYNPDGMLLWARQTNGNDIEAGNRIALDASGNSYITGYFEGSATFGTGEANQITIDSAGEDDIFVAKYSVDGTLLWAKRAGSSGFESGASIALDTFGRSYVTGYFQSSATFGPGEANQMTLNSAGQDDIFVAGYDASGALLSTKRAGGLEVDSGEGVAVDAAGNIYVTGQFRENAVFGSGENAEITLSAIGVNDIFVAKYEGSSPTSVYEKTILLDDFKLAQNYPNPFNPATIIVFEAPKATHVTLAIYNLRGQLIRTLVSGEISLERQQAVWDGTDDKGHKVVSGIYIYELNAGERTATKKMILLQ